MLFRGDSSPRKYMVINKHRELILDAVDTRYAHGKDIRRVGNSRNNPMQKKQASDKPNIVNMCGYLHVQLSNCQFESCTWKYWQMLTMLEAVTSFQIWLDKERSRQVSYVKLFISYKLIAVLKRTLTTRMSLYDAQFSSVLRRYFLEISMNWIF